MERNQKEMTRYIDAERYKKKLLNWAKDCDKEDPEQMHDSQVIEDCAYSIDDEPTVDVDHAKEFETPTVYDHLPDGWRVIDGANTAPNGYAWICNNEPRFGDKYEHGLMKIEYLPERNGMKRE